MRTKLIKIFCLLLVFAFILPALVACPNRDKDKNKVIEVTGTGEDRFKDVDFDGETIKLCLPGAASGSDGAKYMSGVDEKTGKPYENDTITQTVKERNDYVTGKLNLAVEYVYLDSSWSTVYDDLMNKFNAHDGFADAAAIQFGGMVRCMMSGIFTNANTDQYTNYFNLTEAGWYKDSMEAFSLGQDVGTGKIYLLAGDYFLDIIRCADVMFVNETVFENKVGASVNDLYYHIINGSWTYDRLYEWVKVGYNNTNQSDPRPDVDDELGLVYSTESKDTYVPGAADGMAIVYASGINFINNNGGTLEYADVSNSFINLLTKTKAIFQLDGAVGVYTITQNEVIDAFAKNKAMFSMTLRLMNMENSKLDSIEKCPIPYPKLNADAEYAVVVHDLAAVGGIFKGAKFTEASAFWQYATIKSEQTRLKYYEDGLKLKYETGEDTSAILDVIYDSLTTSMPYAWDIFIKDSPNFADATSFYRLYTNSMEDDSFTSKWASCRDLKKNGLGYAQDEFNKLT